MNIPVLGPDVNESEYRFSVNKNGQIRFGLGAVKGVGEAAVESIILERKENGAYKNMFDLVKRVSLRNINKRSMESMVMAGAFDFVPDIHRAQYLFKDPKDNFTNLEKILRFGSAHQENKNSSQHSLFGEAAGNADLPDPKLLPCETWGQLEKLKFEKEVIGFYLSGHPLDEYKTEIKNFCNVKLEDLADINRMRGRDVSFAGIVTEASHRMTKTGKPFGSLTVEDYSGSIQLMLFSEDYLRFKHLLNDNQFLFIKGKVQPRFNSSDQFEVKVNSIQLLAEIGNKLSRSITINIDIHEVNKKKVSSLLDLLNSHKGSVPLKMNVRDSDEKWNVELQSKKLKVNLSKQLFEELEFKEGVEFKIN